MSADNTPFQAVHIAVQAIELRQQSHRALPHIVVGDQINDSRPADTNLGGCPQVNNQIARGGWIVNPNTSSSLFSVYTLTGNWA